MMVIFIILLFITLAAAAIYMGVREDNKKK